MKMLFSVGLLLSIMSLDLFAGYTPGQMIDVAKSGNSSAQFGDSSSGCFIESHLSELLIAGVEVTLENCQYSVPTLVRLAKLGKVKITTNRKQGCYIADQLREILTAGVDVTFKTCQYNLSTLLDFTKYGNVKLFASSEDGSWPITDLMQMNKAGIGIIFH
jgi:hypothetical protein